MEEIKNLELVKQAIENVEMLDRLAREREETLANQSTQGTTQFDLTLSNISTANAFLLQRQLEHRQRAQALI